MKKFRIFLLIGILSFPFLLSAQLLDQRNLQYQKKEIYEHKVMSFTRMKHAGVWLTISGAILTVGGVALIVNGANNSNTNNNPYLDQYDPYGVRNTSEEDAAKILFGTLTACVGVIATTGGVVLWTIGGSKARSYKGKLNSLSFNYNPGPRQLFSLAYRF